MSKEALTNSVHRLAETLIAQRVVHVVVSPGSRSTPLAYALAANDEVNVHMQLDERSAGFLAVGLAKVYKEPVALLCTSGTAASNYLPAITEASYARLPLIVITADRPHELREVGAPQTIDQVKMYSHFVKNSIDFPIAEASEAVQQFIEHQATRLIQTARTAPYGPVHLNIPFREPLLIELEKNVTISPVRHLEPQSYFAPEERELLKQWLRHQRGVIVCGEQTVPFDKECLFAFARAWQWPILADPLSQLRTDVPEDVVVVSTYDALLKGETFRRESAPDVVLRFGAQPTSKGLRQWMEQHDPTLLVVDESPHVRDQTNGVDFHIQSTPAAVCDVLPDEAREETSYVALWKRANDVAERVVRSYEGVDGDEGAIVRQLLTHIPEGDVLFSGSSMPIRDVDTFFVNRPTSLPIYANRGANGIDGVVSSALGVQRRLQRHTWLLIGDLSFLHDLNGLLATRYGETDVTIVVLNNDGGGIFSYLPQSSVEDHYEQLFGTPTSLDLSHAAALYEASYTKITSQGEWKSWLAQPKQSSFRIVEVMTDRANNVAYHRALWQTIEREVERLVLTR